MKTFLTTTAAAMCFAANAQAQTTYLTEVDASSVFGSDYVGMTVFTQTSAQTADRVSVGEVHDLVIDENGTISAVLLDIGGFLGIAEHNIAIKPEMLTIAPDYTTRDDLEDKILIANASEEQLREIPEYTWIETIAAQAMPYDPNAPDESFAQQTVEDVTAQELTGAPVYDLEGKWIGEVSALLIYADTNVSTAIVDVGGFLGIGEKPVELSTDQLIVLRPVGDDALEVRLTTTQAELENMPAYEG